MCLSQGHRFECRIRSVENFNKVDFYWLPCTAHIMLHLLKQNRLIQMLIEILNRFKCAQIKVTICGLSFYNTISLCYGSSS